jgi:hypothetical protein
MPIGTSASGVYVASVDVRRSSAKAAMPPELSVHEAVSSAASATVATPKTAKTEATRARTTVVAMALASVR